MLELLLRGLLFVGEVLLEMAVSYFFYGVGWLALRLLTLGRYPRLPLRVADPMGSRSSWVGAFGFFLIVALPLAALVFIYG